MHWTIGPAVGAVVIVGGLVASVVLRPEPLPWVMMTMISAGAMTQSTIATTESQCKAMIAVVNSGNDPIVVRCLGPKGESAETEWLSKRMVKFPPIPVPRPQPTQPAAKAEL